MTTTKKQLTEVEALTKIKKLLDQLTPESRAKVLKFLSE